MSGKKNFWPKFRHILPLLLISVFAVTMSYYVLFNHYSNFSFVGGNDIVYRIESKLLDWRVLRRGAVKPTGKVAILAIDEKTLGHFGDFPFQRKHYAKAFENLKALGVEWIGFDVIFAEPQAARMTDAKKDMSALLDASKAGQSMSPQKLGKHIASMNNMLKDSPSDVSLSSAIEKFQNIILGYFFFNFEEEAALNLGEGERFPGLDPMLGSEVIYDMPEGKTFADYPQLNKAFGMRSNIPLINDVASHNAYFGNDADDDAINRWVTLVSNVDGHLMPSLSLLSAARFLGRQPVVFFDQHGIESISLIREEDNSEIKIPVDPRGVGRMLVNHRGPGRVTFRHFSLVDAYNNTFTDEEKEALKGSVLLMGATATGTNDIRPNPFDPSIDGVENHAAAVDNIIRQDFFKRPVDIYTTEMMIVIGIGILFTPIMIWAKALVSGLAVILFLAGYFFVDQYLWFQNGTWAFMAVPCMEILTMFFGSMIYKYFTEERERKKVKGVFQAYLSPDVIEQVLADGELQLGGKKMEITIYFSDVRGFTTISESLTPEKLVEFMNTYFTPMTAAILKSGGTLDKYIGDAIMAFWGAPIPLADQSDRAAKVAITHLWELDKLQRDLPARGFPKPDIGIGLNTGPASVGNMGSAERLAYTALGDHVNLAARLEGLTKDYGIKILMSEYMRAKLTPGLFFSRDLDDIRVKGKTQPVKVFELMRPDMLKGNTDLIKNLIGNFEDGRKAYLARDWDLAEKKFSECIKISPDDGPTALYMERIADYKAEPPEAAWDGVYTFKHK